MPTLRAGLREKLIKIGATVVRHGRYITFQPAEVAIPEPLLDTAAEQSHEPLGFGLSVHCTVAIDGLAGHSTPILVGGLLCTEN